MNYFENGILKKSREKDCAQVSICTVRKMTEEEMVQYARPRKIYNDRDEAKQMLSEHAEKTFRRKCRKVRKRV